MDNLDTPAHIEIVQRLTRIETQVENLCANLTLWQTGHQAEDTKVHTEVEKQEKRLLTLETFKTNVGYAMAAAGVALSAIGTAVVAKAEVLLPILFGK